MTKRPSDFWIIGIAFFIIYFVWGSTYLANAWAVKAVPPFLLAGIRFTVAGGLMFVLGLLFGAKKVTKEQWKNSLFAGFMLFAVGNGMVVWALQYVDSGMAALIVALEPLIVVMMMWRMKGERPKWNSWIGVLLGMIGMIFLVGQPHLASNSEFIFGVLAILIALLGWGYISIWMTDANLPDSHFQSAALQMLCGGFISFFISAVMGEFSNFNPELLTPKILWSLVYLIIFGSILAFTSFNYLLTKVSPTKVVTSTYVNPVVALFLGWWLNNELINGQSFLATALLIGGVIFIQGQVPKFMTRRKKKLEKVK